MPPHLVAALLLLPFQLPEIEPSVVLTLLFLKLFLQGLGVVKCSEIPASWIAEAVGVKSRRLRWRRQRRPSWRRRRLRR